LQKDLEHQQKSSTWSRREFLALAGTSAFVVTPFHASTALEKESVELPKPQTIEDPPRLFVIRAQDFLIVEFFFVNLKLRYGAGVVPMLIRNPVAADAPHFIVAEFPPQHLAEQLFTSLPQEVAKKRIASGSRLAFQVPPAVTEIRYTLPDLLQVCLDPRFPLSVPPAAIVAGAMPTTPITLRKPANFETAVTQGVPPESVIELPYRLLLAPLGTTRWEHLTATPQQQSDRGRVELWHTRLASQPDHQGPYHLRAVWTRDDDPASPAGNPPFPMLPIASDRRDIVRATTDFSNADKSRNVIKSERVMLSGLGGWLKARLVDDTPTTSLAAWVQDVTLTRDQYVKIVRRGFLYPYGHRATFVEIAERTYQSRVPGDQEENLVAYLRERLYIVLLDFEKVYTTSDGSSVLPNAGRGLPFKKVRFTIEKSPEITREVIPGVDTRFACWPMLNGRAYAFPLSAVDQNDQTILFDSPIIFVAVDISAADFDRVVANYRTTTDTNTTRPRSAVLMRNKEVAFAPSLSRAPGAREQDTKTVFEAVTITFDIEPQAPGPLAINNPFQPKLREAQIEIPALKQLLNGNLPARVGYPDIYLRTGFEGVDANGLINRGQIFLKALADEAAADFSKSVKDAGGLVTPSFRLAGLSRMIGPVGGIPPLAAGLTDPLETFRQGRFDPGQFFDDSAKILGAIPLKKLLQPFEIGDGRHVPQITTQTIFENGVATALEARLHWEKPISANDTASLPIFIPGPGARIAVNTIVRKSLRGDRTTTREVECVLTDFTIALLPPIERFVDVDFRRVSYRSKTGEDSKVNIDFGGVRFQRKLNFVRELGSLFNPGAKGPRINIDAKGLLAGYSFQLPTLSMGAFSLQNLSLYLGFRLPFDGTEIRLDFGVGTRRNPFLVTVGIFGGGGYFLLGLTASGMKALEIGIEFGGNFVLEIPGIAVGHVYLLAGISYAIEQTPNGNVASITGYVRCGGELRVLSIITVSVTFYMGLTYNDSTRTFIGRASLTIEIDIAFFSVSVELSIERRFGGGDGAFLGSGSMHLASVGLPPPGSLPSFTAQTHSVETLLDRQDWEDYCSAFV
jgi:hypothetical protein